MHLATSGMKFNNLQKNDEVIDASYAHFVQQRLKEEGHILHECEECRIQMCIRLMPPSMKKR